MRVLLSLSVLCCLPVTAVLGDEIDAALEVVQQVGPRGAGANEASAAWQKLAAADVQALPRLLASLDQANPLAANYIRSAIEAIAQKQLDAGKDLPAEALETFLVETSNDPRARRLAYELLLRQDPTARGRLLPKMLHDADVDLRRDAVAMIMQDKNKDAYRQALAAAVDDDQVKEIAAWLKEQGEEVDIARHYGFLPDWHLIGPFDNKDELGYAVPRGPEGKSIDLTATFDASHDQGMVKWTPCATSDAYGKVDLNEVLGKHKGAICYAVAFFDSPQERDAQLRYSSLNACKLYLNGQLIDAHEVYHSGKSLDQYIAAGRLQKGRNTILLKVCQNEQTESWAQDWGFQLRVCDSAGAALHSAER